MTFYITKNNLELCKKRINKMFAKFTHKPVVTYSDVEKVTQVSTTIFISEDGRERECTKRKLDAVKVTIEEIQQGEWRLVASVYYLENLVTMADSTLFKDMPKKFGLEYSKCDCCGHDRERNEAHVLYNTKTGKWMQVGSSCVNKMINGGKYLSNIILDLHECFIVRFGGCDEEDWIGGGWCPPQHHWSAAFDFKRAIMICKSFYDADEKNRTWKRTIWLDSHSKQSGTFDDILYFIEENKKEFVIDEDYISKVFAFIGTLEGGLNYDNEPNLNQKMINAVKNEYIIKQEIFVAYFAVKGYQDSISDFTSICEQNNIVVGTKYNFTGKLLRIFNDTNLYGELIIKAEMTDSTGLHFYKTLSHRNVLDPYKQEDETYKFKADINYINNKLHFVKFGGRLSKLK